MNLKPLGDRVIIKPTPKEEVTKAGIVLPETVNKERPEEGEIIAVGPGKILENGSRSKMELQVGQKVLFTKYGPTEIKIDGTELLVANESDIMAIIE